MEDLDAELQVTGVWKSFAFHVATVEDGPSIVKHLSEHFITEEPLNVYVGGGQWNADRAADTLARIQPALENRLSFYATLKDSKEIVAIVLISDSRQPPPFLTAQPRSPITRKLRGLLTMAAQDTESALQSKFKCDYYAEIFMTSVHREYCRQGIATEMYERTLRFLKAKGYLVVKADFTHLGTQRIGQKLGFEVLHKYYLKDLVDENGIKVCPNARDEEFVVDVAKRL